MSQGCEVSNKNMFMQSVSISDFPILPPPPPPFSLFLIIYSIWGERDGRGEKRREISSQAFGHSWCRAALSLLKLHAYLKLIKHIPYLLSRAFLMQSIKRESSVCVFVYVCGCACPADDLLSSISQLAVKDKWNLWRAASKNYKPIPSVVPGTRTQSLAADVVGEAACVCVCVCRWDNRDLRQLSNSRWGVMGE